MSWKLNAIAITSAAMLCLLVAWQSATIKDLEQRNADLMAELQTAKAVRLADQEAFNAQIKLIREIQQASDVAHGQVNTLSDLSDADWLNAVMRRVFNQTANNSGASSGMDAGTVPGTAGASGTATGKDHSAVQRGVDALRD